ncbi:RTA1 like protein-domain-containing protein [Paraphoma chrysanthemicola]|uniref:RTA1 like protein-domain-containing protein n=1 Tax=Paraphoma chrysanthemicola TaxID=798071 RepID=A0A8K0RDS0_9PLEO|nr:RTA1 like protein-domain-containing protein [Paraphoma chrysanthemicola]
MAESASEQNFFFQYKPSIAGVVIATIVSSIITGVHIFRFVKTFKTIRLKMFVVLSMAAFNEVLGYILRIPGSRSKPSGGLFSLSPLLFFITPLMATSVIYFVFFKIATAIAAHHSSVKLSILIKLWSANDIVCQLLISSGAMVASRGHHKSGKGILLAGIAIHTVMLGVFVVVVAMWHRRTSSGHVAASPRLLKSTQRDVFAIYLSCGLIVVRGLFRFIEVASGPNGPFQKREAPFYFYDFLPIAVASVVCLQWYDSDNLKPLVQATSEEC